jgi:glycosyltransferase involved in cell wall biosynthesis
MPGLKILFVIPYPSGEAPSQRFRFEQYYPILIAHGLSVQVEPFLKGHWRLIYQPGNILKKIQLIIGGCWRRLRLIFQLHQFDYVFIHREAAPVGPPIFEWIAAVVLRKKIIYDFDDAIWKTDKLHEPFSETILRWRRKVSLICRWSYRVSAGNQYLCDYALQFTKYVTKMPTTVDTENVHRERAVRKDDSRIVIGWTGSHSTLKYLDDLIPIIRNIQQKYPQVDFMVIADRDPALKLERYIFRQWSSTSEIDDLLKLDIGVMPLPDDEWSRGKCGFKALQYMSLSIPSVISPVGVNTEIIQHGINGYLCSTDEQWTETLIRLIDTPELRASIGKAGKVTVMERYNVLSNSPLFLSLFQAL